MTSRRANRAALSKVEGLLAGKECPVTDATRAVLMGMQLQAQAITEAQAAVSRVASAYNSTMQAIGSLAAASEHVDTKAYQLDVDRMVWVERKK